MTAALLAGLGMTIVLYVVLDELELVRHGRWIRRTLVADRPARRTLRGPDPRVVWSRITAGELPVRTIQLTSGAALLVFLLGLLTRSLTVTMLGALGGIVIGYAWTQRRRWTLAARVERQLPEAMTVMANALSAGSTLFQALETAGREMPAPLGPLLRQAANRAQLATTIEDALKQLGDDLGSRDVRNLVAALAIGRTTGGDLAKLLRESVGFLRDEQRLRADAHALSAQARYSAQMIGVMPLALFAIFSALFPSFVEPLTTTTTGLLILSYCLLSSALGFYLIWRIATGIERV
jgi:tight adherence protein B